MVIAHLQCEDFEFSSITDEEDGIIEPCRNEGQAEGEAEGQAEGSESLKTNGMLGQEHYDYIMSLSTKENADHDLGLLLLGFLFR
jgi:hypothetical protein